MKKTFSKGVLDALKPQENVYRVGDAACRGLVARVTPAGRVTFVFEKRIGGRIVNHKVGEWPLLTVQQARDRVTDLQRAVVLGRDPTRPQLPTRFGDLATHHVDQIRASGLRPATVAHQTFYTRKLAAALGTLDVRAATAHDWRAALDAVAGSRQGTRYAATGVLRRILQRAVDADVIVRLPVLKAAPPRPRTRYLTWEQLREVWKEAPPFIRFLIAVPARRDEARLLTWRELDLERRMWTLPAARSKNRAEFALPLPGMAVDVLRDLGRGPPEALVFAGKLRGSAVDKTTAIRGVIKRTGIHFTHHDLRRTFVTLLSEEGAASLDVLDALLNHRRSATSGGVIRAYNRATLARLMREAMDRWDGLLREKLT